MTRPASLLLAATALLCAVSPSAAQALHGRVTDASTGAPIAGVRLSLLDPGGTATATARSAADGAFRLSAPAAGAYRVSAHGAGYRVTLTRVVELAAAGDTEAELRMSPAPSSPGAMAPVGRSGPGVHGRVADDESDRPLADATVTLLDMRGRVVARARTDARGTFSVRPRGPGGHTLQAVAEGYRPSTSARLTVTPGDTVVVELRVSQRSILLAPVTVVAASAKLSRDHRLAGFEWRRRRSVQGRFLGPEELRRINPFYVTDALQQVPFVEVRSTGLTDRVVLLRSQFGAGRCLPTVYADGHYVPADAEFPLDTWLSGQHLVGVEVYDRAGAAPPEFPARARRESCGVVVLWTSPPRSRG